MGDSTGGAVLVHVGTNNAEKEGTSAIVGKYRRLIKTLKEARVGQIVLSGILQGKRSRKKHLSKEAIRKIAHKQMVWMVYKHTGNVEDYTKYKEVLNLATT